MYKKTVALVILLLILSVVLVSNYREIVYEVENYVDLNVRANNMIEIPKMKLRETISFVSIESKRINGVVLFEEYGRPDILNSNTVIGAHSGVGLNVFFNKLNILEVGDIFHIYYKDNIYEYLAYKTFEVDEKDLSVLNNAEKTIATLMTCKRSNPTKRIIVLGELIDIID